jgi:hypothetical protein
MTGATLVTSSGYLTRSSRTRGRHRKPPSSRQLVLRRRLALGGSAALLATLIVSVGAVVKWAIHEPASQPTVRPSTPPTAVTPAPPALPVAPPSPPAPFAVDTKGFLNSGARCDGTQTAVAVGRTAGSLVVICGDPSGRYDYRGVRLSDDAVLTATARSTPSRGFIAQHASVSYSVSPTELRITTGGVVIKHEPMLDYRGP